MFINPYSERAERVIMSVIFINSAIIFLYAFGIHHPLLFYADILCSLFFVFEMLLKMKVDGVRDYWHSGWNKLDGTLVILSLPSILVALIPVQDLSVVLIFRLLRAFRFFRVIHFFPGAEQIGRNFRKALRESFSLFVGYFIVICIFSVLSTSLFGSVAPNYFATPLDSIYSIFRLFTIEGWYDIPDAVARTYGTWGVLLTRLYFIFLLIIGGVIGLSLINSVFVDAMVSDNNDDIINRLERLEEKIDKLLEEKKRMEKLKNKRINK